MLLGIWSRAHLLFVGIGNDFFWAIILLGCGWLFSAICAYYNEYDDVNEYSYVFPRQLIEFVNWKLEIKLYEGYPWIVRRMAGYNKTK
jgi:hypothetical protein